MASGGAIYVRDPGRKLVPDQLNGGEFVEITDADWDLIHPYLLGACRAEAAAEAGDRVRRPGCISVYR